MADNDDGNYRMRQKASVSGLTGTSMAELLLVSAPIPMGLWLLSEAKALAEVLRIPKEGAVRKNIYCASFIAEMLVVLFPALLSVIWPSLTGMLLANMGFASVCCRLVLRSRLKTSHASSTKAAAYQTTVSQYVGGGNGSMFPRPEVVTHFRASIMIITCITILAVDFEVFPRRFAKTELYGTGLMDLGVGATVFASGLASGCQIRRVSTKTRRSPLSAFLAMAQDVASVAVRSWPIAVLGISRLVVVKVLGYQEHVSEYGVHWNFFATLFCVRLLVVALSRLRPAFASLFVALASLCGYQWLLLDSLTTYIVEAPRNTPLSMNREGVFGLVGFVAIYFIAKELGRQITGERNKETKESYGDGSFTSRMTLLVGGDAVLWVLTFLSDTMIQQTSRRMVNLTYVLWISAHLTFMLILLIVVNTISSKPPRSKLLSAVNLNMFPIFMVANLATGAVNLSMRTLDADTWTAVTILFIYITCVAGVAATLANRSIIIKTLRCIAVRRLLNSDDIDDGPLERIGNSSKMSAVYPTDVFGGDEEDNPCYTQQQGPD